MISWVKLFCFPPLVMGALPDLARSFFWKGAVDISPVFLGIQRGSQVVPQMPLAKSCQKSLWLIANSCAWSLKTCLVSRHETYRNIKKRNLIFGCKLQLMEFRSIPSLFSHVWFLHPARNSTGSFAVFISPFWCSHGWKKTMKFASISHWSWKYLGKGLKLLIALLTFADCQLEIFLEKGKGCNHPCYGVIWRQLAESTQSSGPQQKIVEISMRWIFFMVNDTILHARLLACIVTNGAGICHPRPWFMRVLWVRRNFLATALK